MPSPYEDSFAMARDFIQRWKDHPLIVPAIAPHAPYTCTAEILRATAELAKEFDVPLHTHIAETALEVDNMRNEQGMPVVPYVKKQGLFEAKVIAAHCVHIDTGEMRTMLHAGAGVSHNPSSNLKLASGFAPVMKMLEIGSQCGYRHRWPRLQQRPRYVRRGAPGSLRRQSRDERPHLPARLHCPDSWQPAWAPRLCISAISPARSRPVAAPDLILVDITPLHNSPSYRRSPDNTYAQIVYAGKSTDVSDVMVNGNWLMRDHKLLTVEEGELLAEAADIARQIDAFLIEREQSVLSKLIALGGSMEQESFEVQVKVKITDAPAIVQAAIKQPGIDIVRYRHYRQHDNYFTFSDAAQGRLRYREDDFLDAAGNVTTTRSRLTLLGPKREDQLEHDVLLSRSRFFAPATQSLRFYREYFKPQEDTPITKDRERWLVKFKDTEFFVNVDQMHRARHRGFCRDQVAHLEPQGRGAQGDAGQRIAGRARHRQQRDGRQGLYRSYQLKE